jgi:hypothetical protein
MNGADEMSVRLQGRLVPCGPVLTTNEKGGAPKRTAFLPIPA